MTPEEIWDIHKEDVYTVVEEIEVPFQRIRYAFLAGLAATEADLAAAREEVAAVWNQFRFQDAAKAEAQAELIEAREQLAAGAERIEALTESMFRRYSDTDRVCRGCGVVGSRFTPFDQWHVDTCWVLLALTAPAAVAEGTGRE